MTLPTPYFQDDSVVLYQGDCADILRQLPAESVQCCVTSPPYWRLRDYDCDGQLGLEPTPEEYVANLVGIFREMRRVLRDDGTLWLNLGDSYGAGSGKQVVQTKNASHGLDGMRGCQSIGAKQLAGIPWRVAFALQADGWWLRQDIIWAKPAPMPESVKDRCTRSHEYIFLLTKSSRYFYDSEAIAEPLTRPEESERATPAKFGGADKYHEASQQSRLHSGNEYTGTPNGKRNKRDVWTVSTKPYAAAHFATFPPDLIRPCILAGTSEKGCCSKCGKPWVRMVEKTRTYESGSGKAGNKPEGKGTQDNQCDGDLEDDIRAGPCVQSKTIGWQPQCSCGAPPVPCVVLDPFSGSGTTGEVAKEEGRKAILIDLKEGYCNMARQRIQKITAPMMLA